MPEHRVNSQSIYSEVMFTAVDQVSYNSLIGLLTHAVRDVILELKI